MTFPDFLRFENRRRAFQVALTELQRTRTLTQALLRPLGLTQKDFREQRLVHGPVKKTAMDRLLDALGALTMPRLEEDFIEFGSDYLLEQMGFKLHDFGRPNQIPRIATTEYLPALHHHIPRMEHTLLHDFGPRGLTELEAMREILPVLIERPRPMLDDAYSYVIRRVVPKR